jgi:hypothetical protein
MIEIVKDRRGTEYKLVKRNRVNWIVEELESGKRLQGNGIQFEHVRYDKPEVSAVDPRIRIGARVIIKKDAPIRMNPKFAKDQDKTFVLIGFGTIMGDFKAIEEGGNSRNAFWNISSQEMELA